MGNITRRLSISEYHNNQPLYFEYEFFNRETNMNNDSGNTTFSDYEMDEDMNCDTTFTQNEGSGVKMESSMSLLLSGLDQDIAMNLDADRQQQQETGGMKKLFKLNKMFRISSRDLIDEPQQIFKKKYFWSRKPTVPILKNSGDSFSEDEDVMTDVETRITTALVNPSKLLAKTPIDAHSMELSSSSTKLSSLEPELLLSSNSSMLSSTNTNNSVELKSKLHFNPHSDLNSNFNSAIVKKQQGMPKTRGRKPSPLLDASKQFGCDYCERRFKRQEHLKRHVRSLHMCEKPYECSICGKKFSRSDNSVSYTHLDVYKRQS